MIYEYKGLTPKLQESVLRCKSIPFSQWSFHADFSSGNLLDDILERRAVIAMNASPFLNLPPELLAAWASFWRMGESQVIKSGNGDWMKFGDFHLSFNRSGTKLTVRKGNKYGWIVDAHECAEWDWHRFLKGCEKVLEISGLPLPESLGKMAGALVPEQKAHKALLELRIPWPATLLAWRAYKGSRMEALSLGSFQGVAIDISSAFPYAASQCPIPYPCIWQESTDFQPHAIYGFAEIDVDIPYELVAAPLAVRIKPHEENELVFPTGKIRCAVSMPELRLLKDMDIPFKIREGWWGFPQTDYCPFQDIMQRLWRLRTHEPAAAKALSVACIGQLGSVAQLNSRTVQGRGAWMPIYAAHILADVRCRIYRQALEVGLQHVKAFAIDGLILGTGVNDVTREKGNPSGFDCRMGDSRTISRNSKTSGFGQWRQESKGQFLIANDFFKDRPGSQSVHDAIQSTPKGHDGRFLFPEDVYVGLKLALTVKEFAGKAGQTLEMPAELPLGSIHRRMPEGLTREDFLVREIETWL